MGAGFFSMRWTRSFGEVDVFVFVLEHVVEEVGEGAGDFCAGGACAR